METVGTRELKQNPQRVIQQVLDNGAELEITSYGRPTGVHLAPDRAERPRRWVSGARLADVPPIGADNAAEWHEEIETGFDHEIVDPWAAP